MKMKLSAEFWNMWSYASILSCSLMEWLFSKDSDSGFGGLEV